MSIYSVFKIDEINCKKKYKVLKNINENDIEKLNYNYYNVFEITMGKRNWNISPVYDAC